MGQHQHHILRSSSVLLWSSIRQHFDGGILYLSDDIAASAAVSPELGAVCIHRLEDEPQKRASINRVHPDTLRACIITSSQLQDVEGSVRSVLQALPRQATVKVLTTSLGYASGVSVWGEDSASASLQDSAAQYSGATVSTGYFPLLLRPVGGPGFEIYLDEVSRTTVAQDLRAATLNDTSRIRQLTDEAEESIKSVERLVHVLSWLRPCLSIKPSLFAAGPVAKCVAETMNELHSWPQALPGSSLRPAALVLVDRAADLPGILNAPRSTIGVAGRPMCTEAGAMGSSAAKWWRAAVSTDPDSHIHASKVLQEALSGLSVSDIAGLAEPDLQAAWRSGSVAAVPLLAAAAAAECSHIEVEAAAAREDESAASTLLTDIPEDAVSIAKTVAKILAHSQGSSASGSTILKAVRALLIGCVTLRTSIGAGTVVNMDPLDSFLSLYGPDIQRNFATAVDRELAKHGGSVQDLVNMLHAATSAQTCRGNLQSTNNAAKPMFPGVQRSVSCAVGEASECIHADGTHPTRGCRRAGAVAESSDWGDDWGQAWDANDARAQSSAANPDADAGWGASGWEDDGDWIDATAVTSPAATVAANVQALAPAPTPAPVVDKKPEPTAQAVHETVSPAPAAHVPAAPRSTTSTDGGKVEQSQAKKKKKIVLKKKVVPKLQETPSAAHSTVPSAVSGSSDLQQVAMESTADSKFSDLGKCDGGDTGHQQPAQPPPAAVDSSQADVAKSSETPQVIDSDEAGLASMVDWPTSVPEGTAAAKIEEPAPDGGDIELHSGDFGAEQPRVSGWDAFDTFTRDFTAPAKDIASVIEPSAPAKENAVADSPQMQDEGSAAEESWGNDAWGVDDWGAEESAAEPFAVFQQVANADGTTEQHHQAPEVHGHSFNDTSADAMHVQPGQSPAGMNDSTEGRVGLDWADRVAGSSGGSAWGASWLTKGLETLASQVEAVVMAPPSESEAPQDDAVHHQIQDHKTLADLTTSSFDEQWSGWQSHITDHHSKQHPMLGRELGSTTSIPGLYTEDAREDSLMVAAQIPEDSASSTDSVQETEPAPVGATAASAEDQASPKQPVDSATGEDEALHQELTFAEHAIRTHTSKPSVDPKGSDGASPPSETSDLSPQGNQTAPGAFENLGQEAEKDAEWGDIDAAADHEHAEHAAPSAPADMHAWGQDEGWGDGATLANAGNDQGSRGGEAALAVEDEWGQDEGWGDTAMLEGQGITQGSQGADAAPAVADSWGQDEGWGDQATLGNAENDQGSWGAWEDDSWNAAQPQPAGEPPFSPPATAQQKASPEASAFAHSLLRAVCRAARAASGHGSLIESITNAALSGGKDTVVPGVVSVRSTMRNMLSHGLGALGLAGADRPISDFSCVVVVVLGGLSMEEVSVVERTVQKLARPAAALAQDKPDVLVGGTSIMTADQVASMLLQACM